jgi:hypothetical protein
MSDNPASRPIHDEPLNNPHATDDWVRGSDEHDDVRDSAVPADLAADPAAFGVPSAPEDDPDVNPAASPSR